MLTGLFTFLMCLLTAIAYIGILLMPVYLVIAFARSLWHDAHLGFSPKSDSNKSA